jgi:hypothetical protein
MASAASSSASSSASAVVSGQQAFAKEHDIGAIFETLEIALIVKKPSQSELLPYIVEELGRITTARSSGHRYVPEGGKGVDTEEGAAKYLNEMGVHTLLEELLTRVLVAKPKNATDFIINECKSRIEAGTNYKSSSTFFTDDDLRGIFSLFDPTHTNNISHEQAVVALKTIGVSLDALSSLSDGSRIDSNAFVGIARSGLHALDAIKV